jgi:hypothetical protein
MSRTTSARVLDSRHVRRIARVFAEFRLDQAERRLQDVLRVGVALLRARDQLVDRRVLRGRV